MIFLEKVPHLSGDASVASSDDTVVPTTPTGSSSLQLPTSLMGANNSKMQLASSPVKAEIFPFLAKDMPIPPQSIMSNNMNDQHQQAQPQFHASPSEGAVPPPRGRQ